MVGEICIKGRRNLYPAFNQQASGSPDCAGQSACQSWAGAGSGGIKGSETISMNARIISRWGVFETSKISVNEWLIVGARLDHDRKEK
jgi:hypothetical protein